jgi:multidrug efflux pump subunit AcrA (membrane-fusion protein)
MADNNKIVKNRGDRFVQIILLVLIAAGIGTIIWLNLSGGKSVSGGDAGRGGYSASSGGAPSSTPAGATGARPAEGSTGGAPGPASTGNAGKQDGASGARPAGGGNTGGAPSGGSAIAVETVPVLRKDVSQYIRVNGDVILENQVAIYSDTNGRLVSTPLSLGDRVTVNQLIAQVDPSLPGQNYSVSSVRSTIEGTVLSLPLQIGDKVTTQTPLAVIGNMSDMMIQTYIPERYIAGLVPGLQAEVSFDAIPGETFSALIREISPIMDITTRTLLIKLKLGKKDNRIRPGMFASMKLITKESKKTLSIPSQALLSYYGDPSVYVIDSNNNAERRIVKTGLSTDVEVEIIQGLSEGELVITQGQSKLTDGTRVRSVSTEGGR